MDRIELTLADAHGEPIELMTVDDLVSFIDAEEQAWGWVKSGDRSRIDMTGHFLNHFNTIRTWIDNFEKKQWNAQQLRENVASYYSGKKPQLLFSESAHGTIIRSIRDRMGLDSGCLALAFTTGRLSPSFDSIEDARIWQLVVSPTMIGPEAWGSEMQRQLKEIRTRMRSEITRQVNASDALRKDWGSSNADDRRRYRSLARMAVTMGSRRAQKISDRANSSVEKLDAVKDAYQEQMRLQAPVKYWADKSRAHSDSAFTWGAWIAIYLVLALLVVIAGFDNAWDALDGEKLTSRHFLLAAVVGAGLTLMFWIARLMVRIFLAERHLHTDAEERRVMTQAYLALIKEGAASDQERIVILSALFRTASDGIVKDDGAGDISLPAMVARLLDSKGK